MCLADAGSGALEGIQWCIHVDAVAQLAVPVQLDAVVAVHQQRAPVAVGRAILERGAAIDVGECVVPVGIVKLPRGVFQVHRFQVPVLVVFQQHRRLHVLQAHYHLVVAVDLQLPRRLTQPQRAGEGQVLRIVAAAIAACGGAGTRRALVVQQRTAKAHRLQVRIEQAEQGGPGIQGRAVFGGQLARGHAITEEQQQVLALLLGQDMAEVVGHGQVIGGDHDQRVLAVRAGLDAFDQLRNQAIGALERIEHADVAVLALVALALAGHRQVPGGVVGVHGQRGQHERRILSRQLLEALVGGVQQHVVMHAPRRVVDAADLLLLLEPRQVMHFIEAVAGQELALAGELAVGTAQVMVGVALLLEVIAQAHGLGQEAAHAVHAVLITLRGGQRHAAHRRHQAGNGPATAFGRGQTAYIQRLGRQAVEIGHQAGKHGLIQIGALQALAVDPDDVAWALQGLRGHLVFGGDTGEIHRSQLLVQALAIAGQWADHDRGHPQRGETGKPRTTGRRAAPTRHPRSEQRQQRHGGQQDEAGDVALEVGDTGAFHVRTQVVQGGGVEPVTGQLVDQPPGTECQQQQREQACFPPHPLCGREEQPGQQQQRQQQNPEHRQLRQ